MSFHTRKSIEKPSLLKKKAKQKIRENHSPNIFILNMKTAKFFTALANLSSLQKCSPQNCFHFSLIIVYTYELFFLNLRASLAKLNPCAYISYECFICCFVSSTFHFNLFASKQQTVPQLSPLQKHLSLVSLSSCKGSYPHSHASCKGRRKVRSHTRP